MSNPSTVLEGIITVMKLIIIVAIKSKTIVTKSHQLRCKVSSSNIY